MQNVKTAIFAETGTGNLSEILLITLVKLQAKITDSP